jgi:hypothetical protein
MAGGAFSRRMSCRVSSSIAQITVYSSEERMLDKRRSAPQTIAWFLDLFHARQLDMDPEYQRRSVWNDEYKRYFIDTIFKNYPSPAIFLDVEISAVGRTVYHVVDGKQRLSSIIGFVQDEFAADPHYSGPEVGGKYFSQLTEAQRTIFLRYILPVEFLDNASESDLQQAFDRLNRNVSRLNAQELRHARFSGAFINQMETLAEDPFWKDLGIATPTRIRRMQDVEFVSEIFATMMHGLEKDLDLDELYAAYDSEIPNYEHYRQEYENTKTLIARLLPGTGTARFRNLADFFSLWHACLVAIRSGRPINEAVTAPALGEFVEAARDENTNVADAKRYLVAVTQGSNKAANRKLRADLLAARVVYQ